MTKQAIKNAKMSLQLDYIYLSKRDQIGGNIYNVHWYILIILNMGDFREKYTSDTEKHDLKQKLTNWRLMHSYSHKMQKVIFNS